MKHGERDAAAPWPIDADPAPAAGDAARRWEPPADRGAAVAAEGLLPCVWRGILDGLAFGIAVIDDQWRVGYVNRAAAAILERDPELATTSGVLVIRRRQLREQVRTWLSDGPRVRATATVARVSGHPPIVLEYLARLTDASRQPAHVLALLDAGRPPAVDPDRLMSVFGLTRAEARLVAALAAGETLQSFAQRQGVTVATMRSHLENACAKTGARRQAQVVRLALACVAPFALPASPANAGDAEADIESPGTCTTN